MRFCQADRFGEEAGLSFRDHSEGLPSLGMGVDEIRDIVTGCHEISAKIWERPPLVGISGMH